MLFAVSGIYPAFENISKNTHFVCAEHNMPEPHLWALQIAATLLPISKPENEAYVTNDYYNVCIRNCPVLCQQLNG